MAATSIEFKVDPKALKAAELTNDWMANGYSDCYFGFGFNPPAHQRDRVSYMRGYERAGQQQATSIEEEYKARTGRDLEHTFERQIYTVDDCKCGKKRFQHG